MTTAFANFEAATARVKELIGSIAASTAFVIEPSPTFLPCCLIIG